MQKSDLSEHRRQAEYLQEMKAINLHFDEAKSSYYLSAMLHFYYVILK